MGQNIKIEFLLTPFPNLPMKMKKFQAQSVISFVMYSGLALVAIYILIAGPIKDLIKNETTFTESLQNINGKLYI